MKPALILLAAIFAFDLVMPFGMAIGLLYTICIFLVVKESKQRILIVTGLAIAFTVIKFAVYYTNEVAYYFIVNRIITVLTLSITAAIAIRFRLLHERQQFVDQIERRNKESEEFIYIASHDLNEPIRTIQSMSDLLEKKYSSRLDSDGKIFLQFIRNSTDRMGMLVRSLLEYGRIGRNAVFEPIDLNEVVKDSIGDLQQLISESKASIVVGKMPVAEASKEEMRILFQNLITNAIKFGHEGTNPVVRVEAVEKRNSWKFMVSDNGIGIEPQNLEKIFVMFKRLHAREDYGGTGIGLAHCRKIVEMHNGRIWAKSRPGEGTTFYFTLPKSQ